MPHWRLALTEVVIFCTGAYHLQLSCSFARILEIVVFGFEWTQNEKKWFQYCSRFKYFQKLQNPGWVGWRWQLLRGEAQHIGHLFLYLLSGPKSAITTEYYCCCRNQMNIIWIFSTIMWCLYEKCQHPKGTHKRTKQTNKDPKQQGRSLFEEHFFSSEPWETLKLIHFLEPP